MFKDRFLFASCSCTQTNLPWEKTISALNVTTGAQRDAYCKRFRKCCATNPAAPTFIIAHLRVALVRVCFRRQTLRVIVFGRKLWPLLRRACERTGANTTLYAAGVKIAISLLSLRVRVGRHECRAYLQRYSFRVVCLSLCLSLSLTMPRTMPNFGIAHGESLLA